MFVLVCAPGGRSDFLLLGRNGFAHAWFYFRRRNLCDERDSHRSGKSAQPPACHDQFRGSVRRWRSIDATTQIGVFSKCSGSEGSRSGSHHTTALEAFDRRTRRDRPQGRQFDHRHQQRGHYDSSQVNGALMAEESSSTIRTAAEVIETASSSVKSAIEKGREPQIPLGIVSALAREAPLPALLIAFLLGVLVARG